jgi:hypothetical protein
MTALYNLAAARAAADAGQLAEWIDGYLRTGEWINLGLADGLHLAPRWWSGPLKISLDRLARACGPEPEMPYRMPIDSWNQRVTRIVDSLDAAEDLPPLIAQFTDDTLYLRDGNHRHEALRRAGFTNGWVVVWSDSASLQAEFESMATAMAMATAKEKQ